MSLLQVRPARSDEALAVALVHVEADRQTYQPIFAERFEGPGLAASTARWQAALDAGDDLLVATEQSRIVGFGHVAGAWMSALYLLASHHRRGLGARLLARLRARALQRGVAELGFQVVAANAPAIAFYEAQGARPVGRQTEGEGARASDDVVFALATGGAGASRRR